MGTVVINNSDSLNTGLLYNATEAARGSSSVSLGGGWFFYSNNPEPVHYASLADSGRWLNRVAVTGAGHIYTWHSNKTGYTINACILIYNPNSFEIKVTSSNYGITNTAGIQPDSEAWLSFWNTSYLSPVSVVVPAGGYGNLFLSKLSGIPNNGVFGVIARLNVTNNSTGSAASATLYDLAWVSNSGGASQVADPDGTGRPRGIASTGYWNTINFATITPANQYGTYYTLASPSDTFSGADVPYVSDPSGRASNYAWGNYGAQMNISLPIYNSSSSTRTFRIYVGSTGGGFFPAFYYKGTGYRYSPPGKWGNIEHHDALDILEVQVGANTTVTETFQVVVPAVSNAPLCVGARLK